DQDRQVKEAAGAPRSRRSVRVADELHDRLLTGAEPNRSVALLELGQADRAAVEVAHAPAVGDGQADGPHRGPRVDRAAFAHELRVIARKSAPGGPVPALPQSEASRAEAGPPPRASSAWR